MSGVFSFDPPQQPQLGLQPVPLAVAIWERPEGDGDGTYFLLPNIICESIERRDGAQPSIARFRYLLDNADPSSPYPASFTDFFPIDGILNDYVAQVDDEIVVFGYSPSGTRIPIFDGFVVAPQADVDMHAQMGSFSAVGVEVRCWDIPISIAIYRNAEVPKVAGGEIKTALPTHFNPNKHGVPLSNCTPDGFDVNQGNNNAYPVFIEENLQRQPDPAVFWTLPKFVRYLLGTCDSGVREFVSFPTASSLDSLLVAMNPVNGQYYDPNDPETYEVEDIVIRDYDCTGDAFPEALEHQLNYYGFGIRFELSADGDDNPITRLIIYRRDDLSAPAVKPLYLQQFGATVDPGLSNATTIRLSRDQQNLQNYFDVYTRPILYEVSIVLTAGFAPNASDVSNMSNFLLSAISGTSSKDNIRAAYRRYIADEAGDGHFDYDTVQFEYTALDLSSVFLKVGSIYPSGAQAATYVHRYRPGKATLISKDDLGVRRRASLEISRDYAGAVPGVWDGTGTWDSCGDSGWRLLKDRLGIEITADNPEAWKIPLSAASVPQVPGGVVRGITSQANPGTDQNSKLFYLKLTTVIESDQRIYSPAKQRQASPSLFQIRRLLEAKDHFRREVVDESSPYFTANPTPALRDDTPDVQSYANSMRAAHEFPAVTGTVNIPQLTNAYEVGDRINMISGVNLNLQSNAGVEQGEAPWYPQVVAVTYQLGDGQTTILHLSARREGAHPSEYDPSEPVE